MKSLESEFLRRVSESQGILHKVCNLYCDDKEERKDLLQEIMIQLWKSYPSFRGDSKFSSWMYRVGLNVSLQYFRKTKNKKKQSGLTEGVKNIPAIESNDSSEQEAKYLRSAISKLNPVEKAIMLLHLEEKSNQEIAEIIGITQNNVRVKMNRIRNKLKNILKLEFDGNH